MRLPAPEYLMGLAGTFGVLLRIGVAVRRANLNRRKAKPAPAPALDDPDFGSLEYDEPQWVGRYDTGGRKPTEVLLAGGPSGPSPKLRQRFRDFRAAYPALEARIAAVLDPEGVSPRGAWWLAYVEPLAEDPEDAIELTYASRSKRALRAIRIEGDLAAPTIHDLAKPESTTAAEPEERPIS